MQESSRFAFFSLRPQTAEPAQTHGVTLWDLLTLISFVVPAAGASAEAKLSHARLVGYIPAISAGLAIGACCAVCMRIALLRVGGYLTGTTNASRRTESLIAAVMLIAALIWILSGDFAGGWLAGKILRLLP